MRPQAADALVRLVQQGGRRVLRIARLSDARSTPMRLFPVDLTRPAKPEMNITSLKLFKVAVPLRKVVRHASFERSVSENLVVRVRLSDGVDRVRRGRASVLRHR